MRGFLTLMMLLSLTVAGIAGSKPVTPVFHGERAFSQSELASFVHPLLGDSSLSADTAAISRALLDSLTARDYLFAKTDSFYWLERRAGRQLHVVVREGEPPRVGEVEWRGDSAAVAEILKQHPLTVEGRVFHWSTLRFDLNRMLDFFEDGGYPFARITVERMEPDRLSGTVNLVLSVSPGPRVTVGYLLFEGNRLTEARYLERESRLRRGEIYSQRRVDAARRKLARLEFVRKVEAGRIVTDASGATGVNFPLEESRSTRLDMVAGYQPQRGNEGGFLTGLVNLEFLNLFGSGRKGRLHWERPGKSVQDFEIAYQEPWLANQPLALEVGFAQRIEDTLYANRKISAKLTADLGGGFMLWGLARNEAVLADSASQASLGIPASRTNYLESGFSFDTRDHPTNPRGGVFFSTFAGSGWRHTEELNDSTTGGSFTLHRGGMDSEVALELLPFWIADLSLHARAVESDEADILQPDLYRLGGARTLRGYREEQFLGSRAGWSSLELRYWLGPASRVFVFTDGGGVFRKKSAGTASSGTLLRLSGGLGLRLETGLGVWGFDYGVGQEDKAYDGKVHVSLLSQF